MPARQTIEDIILSHDKRGIASLRPYLPSRFCEEAASFILGKNEEEHRTVFITTGFYILKASAPETDGPLGVLALAKALKALGYNVIHVTDKYTQRLLKLEKDPVISFPITDDKKSLKYAYKILAEYNPCLLISIERCGLTADGRYLNMAGKDISQYTARVDYLFMEQENTIGVGDGGNEIGMGNLADKIRITHNLPDTPAVTRVNKLVIASVSNWGAYGLVAALSRLKKRNLLPDVEWERKMLREIVDMGAVDGVSGEKKYAVDAFTEEENSQILTGLHKLLLDSGIK